jgi:hypothetical protein
MTDAELGVRVGRLERVARRDRLFALGALVMVLATAQAPSPRTPLVVSDPAGGGATLTANGLAVRDAAGHVRVALGLDTNGFPSLDLSDSTGVLREAMYLLKDRPVMRLFDPAGKVRAEMFLSNDTQNAEFVLRDAASVIRLAVFQGTKGLPEFSIYGTDAVSRAYWATDDSGSYLVMKDAKAVSRVIAGQYSDGKFGLEVCNSAGATAWSRQ